MQATAAHRVANRLSVLVALLVATASTVAQRSELHEQREITVTFQIRNSVPSFLPASSQAGLGQ
jgi:two-component sensor histidine kinase